MVNSYIRGPSRLGKTASFGDAAGVKFASTREVRAYWDALRDDQDLPRREQINPRGMAGALHQVFMLERVAPGIGRVRLAGMDINDLMGMEVRGMPLSALFDPAARARLAQVLEKVLCTRTIVTLHLEADRGIGRPALSARLLMLPLKGASGEADLILGCLACDGQIGRAPRRFVIAGVIEEPVPDAAPGVAPSPTLRQQDAPKPGNRTAFAPRPAMRLVAELAEPAAPAFKPAKPAAGRPYLRLVQGDA